DHRRWRPARRPDPGHAAGHLRRPGRHLRRAVGPKDQRQRPPGGSGPM
ncbi:MAG: hypothetical protein AVDCRST_MAG33-1099, partial [uncultured Thermomicrobiales bacterium]